MVCFALCPFPTVGRGVVYLAFTRFATRHSSRITDSFAGCNFAHSLKLIDLIHLKSNNHVLSWWKGKREAYKTEKRRTFIINFLAKVNLCVV